MDALHSDSTVSTQQICWELAEIFNGLSEDSFDELIAKNVPADIAEFASRYGDDFSKVHGLTEVARTQIPSLILLGYLARIVEERLGQAAPA
ncbi:MAG: hypothetical protein VX546_06730 [Myxococcota bacterium]|nr:hypothetical protein [Myxococcota bacterium]